MDYIWRALALTVAVLAGGQVAPQSDLNWIRDGRPTPQARAVVQALRGANAKGLNPEDYNASGWAARLDHFRAKASGVDLARFDLELTIAVTRYVSDLRTGRVNPKLFHHGFDLGREDHDAAKFVRTRLADAVDVKAELDGVEPP